MNADHCHGVVTRDGIEDACGKPPTSIIDDPDGGPWPACAYHAHRYGNGRVVPLAQIVANERERIAQTIETDPSVRLGHNVSVVCSCLRCEVAHAAARIARSEPTP